MLTAGLDCSAEGSARSGLLQLESGIIPTMLTLRSLPKMTKWLALVVFAFLTCVGVGIGVSRFHIADLKPSDGVLLFAGLLPAAVVWWQGYLNKQQNELQAIIELGREWNSRDMLDNRRESLNIQNEPEMEN